MIFRRYFQGWQRREVCRQYLNLEYRRVPERLRVSLIDGSESCGCSTVLVVSPVVVFWLSLDFSKVRLLERIKFGNKRSSDNGDGNDFDETA